MDFRSEYKGFTAIRLSFFLKTTATQSEAERLVQAIEHECPVSSTVRQAASVVIERVVIEK